MPIKRPDDFVAMAKRGFYVYDWRDVHRTSARGSHNYEAIAVPQQPTNVSDLPKTLKVAASKSQFKATFARARLLDVMEEFDCLDGS